MIYGANENTVLNILSAQTFVKVLEIGIVGIILIYVFFAFLVTRQVRLMNNSFSTPLSGLFRMVAILHLIASLTVAGIAVLAL